MMHVIIHYRISTYVPFDGIICMTGGCVSEPKWFVNWPKHPKYNWGNITVKMTGQCLRWLYCSITSHAETRENNRNMHYGMGSWPSHGFCHGDVGKIACQKHLVERFSPWPWTSTKMYQSSQWRDLVLDYSASSALFLTDWSCLWPLLPYQILFIPVTILLPFSLPSSLSLTWENVTHHTTQIWNKMTGGL